MVKIILLISLGIPVFLSAQVQDTSISKQRLENTVRYLSGNKLKGRFTGSPGMDSAAAYISNQFLSFGLKPALRKNDFRDSFNVNIGKSATGVNIIASLDPVIPNDTMIIISAHYDHVGIKGDSEFQFDNNSSDEIYNGANDNATGVAAMIELARHYSITHINKYKLIFAAFAGEELGMMGSSALARKMKKEPIKTVINLEMLGRGSTGKCFVATLSNSAVRKTLNATLSAAGGNDRFFTDDPYPDEQLGNRSDHYSFQRIAKQSFTIMATSPTDKFYHSPGDEADTIDYDFLQLAVKNISIACKAFIE